MSFNNFDANHRPSRTSSNDTYSLVSGQSNPDSPGSSASGLSSPLDAQSYDNLQSTSKYYLHDNTRFRYLIRLIEWNYLKL